jgi:hypothetical protein
MTVVSIEEEFRGCWKEHDLEFPGDAMTPYGTLLLKASLTSSAYPEIGERLFVQGTNRAKDAMTATRAVLSPEVGPVINRIRALVLAYGGDVKLEGL